MVQTAYVHRRLKQVISASILVGGGATAAWALTAPVTEGANRIGIGGFLVALLGLALSVAMFWPTTEPSQILTGEELDRAADYLAQTTLAYWSEQAQVRGVTTPVPATVNWRWASPAIASPPEEIPAHQGKLFSEGEVGRMRLQLYSLLPRERARIVMIGGPGSGKTGAMLLLLLDILQNRKSEPVPIWLTLGSWNPRVALVKWAAETVARDYPGLVVGGIGAKTVAEELIRARRVALFMDGFDEMPLERRAKALRTIDRDTSSIPLMITSRPQEFQYAVRQSRLYGAAVVETRPIDPRAARDFLIREQLGIKRIAWEYVADYISKKPTSVAARTLVTPLALALARDAYSRTGEDPRELIDERQFASPEQLMRHLLKRLVVHAYPDNAAREHAMYWLGWVAHRMGTNRDLRWWEPILLGYKCGKPRRVANRSRDEANRPIGGKDRPSASAGSDELAVRRMRIMVLGAALVAAVCAVQLVRIAAANSEPLPWPWTVSLSIGIAFGIGKALGGSANWHHEASVATATTPIDTYRGERRFAFRGATACLFLVGASVSLSLSAGVGLLMGVVSAIAFAYGPAVNLALLEGRLFLRHFRGVDFIDLFEEALARQIFRQVGATYQFRHAALQDHMAASFVRKREREGA